MIQDTGSPKVQDNFDNDPSFDEAFGDGSRAFEDDEPLPWQCLLNKPLEQVFALDNDKSVGFYTS